MRYKMFCEAMSLEQFCGYHYKITKSGILVLCTASLCFYYSLHPPRHTLNQILTNLWVNHVPFILYPLPQLQYPIGLRFIVPKPSFEVMPKVLNRIEVWRLLAIAKAQFHGHQTTSWPICRCAWGHCPAER